MGHQDKQLIDEIKALVPVSQVAARHVELKRDGCEYLGLSPFKTERTPSFTVNDDKGFYHCFSSHETGDQFDLLMKLEGLSFPEAKAELMRMAGLSENGALTVSGEKHKKQAARRTEQAKADAEFQKQRYKSYGQKIFHEAYASAQTLVETYLRWRNVDLDALYRVYGYCVPGTLRFSPSLYYQRCTALDGTSRIIAPPAMVAAVETKDRVFAGVHRTWLSSDGRGKFVKKGSKRVLGDKSGNGIPLSPRGPHCVIGEGIETTLSAMAELARQNERVFGLCGVDMGNIAGRALKRRLRRGQEKPKYNTEPDLAHPGLVLPDGIERVTLLADCDGEDPEAGVAMMERAANKFRQMGVKEVRIALAPIGCDFNDMVGADGYNFERAGIC